METLGGLFLFIFTKHMTEKLNIKKTCPKCGNAFDCNGEECWCHAYNILNKDIHFIRQTWDDCLCPSCLKEFADNK